MAIFYITLWKNAILAYFVYFIKRKSAEMVIFYIILWKNTISAFFSFYYAKSAETVIFHITL
jgi:hypothetical protein